MTLFILLGVLLLIVWAGISVINGGRSRRVPADEKRAIQRWEKARQRGFLLHCTTRFLPFVIGFCLLGPVIKTWWTTGLFGYPTEGLGFYVVYGVVFTLVVGFLDWKTLESRAMAAKSDGQVGQRPPSGE